MWAYQNIGGKVVKSDKCMGDSQLLGARARDAPKVYAYASTSSITASFSHLASAFSLPPPLFLPLPTLPKLFTLASSFISPSTPPLSSLLPPPLPAPPLSSGDSRIFLWVPNPQCHFKHLGLCSKLKHITFKLVKTCQTPMQHCSLGLYDTLILWIFKILFKIWSRHIDMKLF